MVEEQVDVVGAECLECAIERPTRVVWSVEPIVELAGEVNLAAIQPRSPDRLPYFGFMRYISAVSMWRYPTRRASMTSVGSLSRIDLEDSEAELRNLVTAIEDEIRNRH